MTTEEHIETLHRRYQRAQLLLVGACILAVLAVLGLLVFNSIRAAEQRRTLQAQSDLIQSCVDPEGKCFQDAARRQADIIGDPAAPINTVTILAATCGAAHPGDVAATRTCVLAGLDRQTSEETP